MNLKFKFILSDPDELKLMKRKLTSIYYLFQSTIYLSILINSLVNMQTTSKVVSASSTPAASDFNFPLFIAFRILVSYVRAAGTDGHTCFYLPSVHLK